MKARISRAISVSAIWGAMLLVSTLVGSAQTSSVERNFPQTKATIENALQAMQASMSGRLPVLEGFAAPGEHPLDRYQHGYYQASAEIIPASSGGCTVRMRVKVTAWHSELSSRSGYRLLASNGRLESDLLDQLAEQLSAASPGSNAAIADAPRSSLQSSLENQPSAPEPFRKFPDSGMISSAVTPNSADSSSKPDASLKSEAENLEQILKNMAHPRNLVAVRKSGTPVVSNPSLTAKPQFLASIHDEFELLDFNADWVHVRISGLSRGWIWRNSVEMPEGIPDTAASSANGMNTAADLFHVVREETAPFPGDWEPLRGKSVKIISVQKVDESAQNVGSSARLEFAKFLLEKNSGEVAEEKQEIQGIVVVFDSADGGMIAAPAQALQQWKAGALTDSALWHKCFFDPPETFNSSGSSGGR